jgi:hypothetical protein
MLRSNVSSRSLKRRLRELEKISARINGKMVKLERMLARVSKSY